MGIEPRTEVRRVVTTHDETGKAVVMIDDQTPHKTVTPGRGTGSWRVWVTKNIPVDMEGQRDLGADQIGPSPPKNGTAIRIMDFPGNARNRQAADRSPVEDDWWRPLRAS